MINKKIKKIITICMTIMLIVMSFQTVFASEITSNISSSNNLVNTKGFKLSDIDSIIDQRNIAFLKGDTQNVNALENKLNNMGLESASYDEISKMINLPQKESNSSSTLAAASSNNSFTYTYTTFNNNGTLYDVLFVYVVPTSTSSNLCQTGVTALKNSSTAEANTMKFVNIAASSVAGLYSDSIGFVQTVYGALSAAASTLAKSSTIKNISASYTWQTAQTCVFCYVKSSVTNTYVQASEWAKISSNVDVIIPTLTWGSNGAIASSIYKNYNGTAVPNGFEKTANAIAYYNIGAYHIARISSVAIKGIEGKTVHTVNIYDAVDPSAIW